ncbi:MAG: hypothetical protein JWQ72_140 [Polaromonas sp.]|nr:hypothetical protein [Polaromonas sp.]
MMTSTEDRAYGRVASDSYLVENAAPQSHVSAVSWGAIFAGAAGAAALSLILLILGTGLGLSSVSPWADRGAGATAFGIGTIAWLTFTQLAASGLGGYLAGRLRTRWLGVHTDEVYFRDTAHGFLAWAIASLATAALLGSVIGAIVGTGVQAGASVAGSAVTAAGAATAGGAAAMAGGGKGGAWTGGAMDPTAYFVDTLFRRDAGAPAGSTAAGSATAPSASGAAAPSADPAGTAGGAAEVARIFAQGAASSTLPPEDVRYVGQVVAQRTGLSQQDAEKRVTDTYARMQAKARDAENAARDAADKARKASSYAALWLFISLLIGAFIASLAATFGGRQRDL